MTTALHRRVKKIEAIVQPIAIDRTVKVLHEPAEGASPKDLSTFAKTFAAARKVHDLVIVVDPKCERREDGPRGVIRVPDEMNARFIELDSLPSQTGRPNRLCDVLASLNGNVIGPVPEVPAPPLADGDNAVQES